MRNKKGFTLIELLAVIVILSIILVIATTNVIRTINQSKEKARYIAAKEIIDVAEIYFATNSGTSVTIDKLSSYLETDATNPATGGNDLLSSGFCHIVRKGNFSEQNNYSDHITSAQTGYYLFDGYKYEFKPCS